MMDPVDTNLAAPFEAVRRRLWGIAYRMLGTAAEADDIVQDTFLRWQRSDRSVIDNPEAWLVRTCTRIAIDALRAAKRSRVDYVGPWLPEPLAVVEPETDMDESLSMAFLLVLERLTPAERAAFLLRDVFDYDYARIADIVGRSEVACRQLVTRGRRHLRQQRQRHASGKADDDRLLDAFLAAVTTGELASLEMLLSRDVELWADGGGKVTAAMNVVHGSAGVARFLEGLWRKYWSRGRLEPTLVGGLPGVLVVVENRVYAAIGLSVDQTGRVARVLIVRNPDKLGGFGGGDVRE